MVLLQRPRAVRLALHSPTWLGFRWLCLAQFLWFPPLRRFLWFLSLRRFLWFLSLRRCPWVLRLLRWRVALRSRTCLARLAVKEIRLIRRPMEHPCPVSQFCLALEPDGALALIPHRGYARESQLLHEACASARHLGAER